MPYKFVLMIGDMGDEHEAVCKVFNLDCSTFVYLWTEGKIERTIELGDLTGLSITRDVVVTKLFLIEV